MEDQLKKWADSHRQEFELYHAPDTAWANIARQMEQAQGKQVRLWPLLARVAAGLALVLVAAWWALAPPPPADTAAAQYPELLQAEQQYGPLIKAKMTQVRHYHDQHLIAQLLADIEELELEFNALKKDLGDQADNRQLVQAMIENYRIRLMLLERFLQEIDKTENSEHVEIKS